MFPINIIAFHDGSTQTIISNTRRPYTPTPECPEAVKIGLKARGSESAMEPRFGTVLGIKSIFICDWIQMNLDIDVRRICGSSLSLRRSTTELPRQSTSPGPFKRRQGWRCSPQALAVSCMSLGKRAISLVMWALFGCVWLWWFARECVMVGTVRGVWFDFFRFYRSVVSGAPLGCPVGAPASLREG